MGFHAPDLVKKQKRPSNRPAARAGQEENRVMMRQMFLLLAAVALIASSGCKVLEKNCSNCGQKQAMMQQTPQQMMQQMPQQMPQQMMQQTPQQVMQAQAQQMMQAQAMAPANSMMQQSGPGTAAYAYPYYTVRAPRDFFMKNPPSIGN